MNRLKEIFVIALVVVCANSSFAHFSTGLIPEKTAGQFNANYTDFYDDGRLMAWKIWGLKKITLRPFAPRIGDQIYSRSCVGWSVGYSAFSIQNAIERRWQYQTDRITANAFSGYFIYNQVRSGNCNDGARISDALYFLLNFGDIPYHDFEMQGADCETQPNDSQIEQAKANRIKGFQRLFNNEIDPARKIIRTKQILTQSEPVIIAFQLHSSFIDLKTGTWEPTPKDTVSLGFHAMVVIGFDEEKGAFEIMNSWGEDWGEKGFAWIKYSDFGKYCTYAFRFTNPNDHKERASFTGHFEVQRLVSRTGNVSSFASLYSTRQGGYYQINAELYPGDKIRIATNDLSAGRFIYAFGVDLLGEIHVYAEGEARQILELNSENQWVISTERNMPVNVKTGKEYLFVIYGNQPIYNILEKLELIQPGIGDYGQQVQNVFKPWLREQSLVSFDNNQIKFETDPQLSGNVLLAIKLGVRK